MPTLRVQKIAPTILAKKRKADILEEYQKLLANFEALNDSSKDALDHDNKKAVMQMSKMNLESDFLQSISKLKVFLSDNLGGFLRKTNDSLDGLADKISEEVEKFKSLQRAVELSRKELEVGYHIKVGAQTLEQLVDQYEEKNKKLERDFKERLHEIEVEISDRKKAWKREEEEYLYNLKTKRLREEAEYQERKKKEEVLFKEKEKLLKERLDEFELLKKEAEKFPERLEKEVKNKEEEVKKALTMEYQKNLEIMKKDWMGQCSLMELKIKNLEDQLKRQERENQEIKKELEEASTKAQRLAMKVVESSYHKDIREEIKKNNE